MFYIGQTFKDNYPPEAASWCDSNNATIEVLDSGDCVIVALPEPTIEEQNEVIRQTRASLYANLVDPLHAEKQRKVVLGTWTEEMEAEYVAKVQELTAQIQTENPYVQETVDIG